MGANQYSQNKRRSGVAEKPTIAAFAIAFMILIGSLNTPAIAGEVGDGCSIFYPCDEGLNCQPGVHKCFNVPRRESQPCSLGYGCADGLRCEAGAQICRKPGGSGDACHATRPCADGLNCQPGVQKCFNVPRRENEPCSLGYGCAEGLNCEAGAQICRKPGAVGDACHATRPCAGTLNCHPGVHKCFNVPRRENEPCSAGYGCGDGLHCEAGAHLCRKASVEGERCHATLPCADGMSCQPGVHKCFPHPRKVQQPCSAGYECEDGLFCPAGVHVCVPKSYQSGQCRQMRVQALVDGAKNANMTMSFGSGISAAISPAPFPIGVSGAVEKGGVYGQDGKFGCYISACVGAETDANFGVTYSFGGYNSWEDFAGESIAISEGASFPFIEIGGFTATQFVNDKGRLLGAAATLSIGLGVIPVQVGAQYCSTTVIDASENIETLDTAAENQAKAAKQVYDGNASKYKSLYQTSGRVYWKRLRNFWKPKILIQANANAPRASKAGDAALSAQWSIEKAGGKHFMLRFRNRADPKKYLYAGKNGLLRVQELRYKPEEVRRGWSPEWLVEEGIEGHFRFKSALYPNRYLNIENGDLQLSEVEPGWHSAMWKEELVESDDFVKGQDAKPVGNVVRRRR